MDEETTVAFTSAIHNAFVSSDADRRYGDQENVASALLAIGDAIVRASYNLGNGNAATQMGALEAHGLAVKQGCEAIASAISELAEAIRERE